ncbi:hypothetical protein Leryth_002898 [Lithospermum erythrorhizon]|nr:hypothetical protein Leryth_002898 [Lithospermum erythrorhizon]
MSNSASPSDKAAELLQPKNSPQASEVKNETAEVQYAPVDTSVNGLMNPVERSYSPFMDPNLFYSNNGYPPSHTYYYGGNEWDTYVNPDGSEIAPGVYGDYQQGYGYLPYGTYSPSSSTMGHDGHLYGAQHYQYPNYFQPSTSASGTYTHKQPGTSQTQVSSSVGSNQLQLPVDMATGNQGSMENAFTNQYNMSKPLSSNYQNSSIKAKELYGYGNPLPGSDISNSAWQSNYSSYGKNQNFRSDSNTMGSQNRRATSGLQQPGFVNKMYTNNRMYGHYGNVYGSGPGFSSSSYYPGNNNQGFLSLDNKYRSRNRNNGAYGGYGKDNEDERKRGPRFDVENGSESIEVAGKGKILPQKKNSDAENLPIFPGREECNKDDFPETYTDAKFFVIKSYSEDDVHKSIKYGVWTSTTSGNKKLDAAYKEAQEKPGGCPVFLFFSVNASGQFVGLAEMLGPVEFDKTVDHWQQDKWHGCFPVKWHIIKDVPNSTLRHIKLENNENKPVTNSRDTQEVCFDQGLQIIKIFKSQVNDTCILDDFEFYEGREKVLQEKKARQRQFNKQAAGLTEDAEKATMDKQLNNLSLDSTKESTPLNSGTTKINGEPKLLEQPEESNLVADVSS